MGDMPDFSEFGWGLIVGIMIGAAWVEFLHYRMGK